MFLPTVLDPISREFLWFQYDWYCKNTFWAWTGQGLQKLTCSKFLCRERMKLIIDQINPCDVILKKTLQNVLRSLVSNPIILRKFKHTVSLLTFRPRLLFKQSPESSRMCWYRHWCYILHEIPRKDKHPYLRSSGF